MKNGTLPKLTSGEMTSIHAAIHLMMRHLPERQVRRFSNRKFWNMHIEALGSSAKKTSRSTELDTYARRVKMMEAEALATMHASANLNLKPREVSTMKKTAPKPKPDPKRKGC